MLSLGILHLNDFLGSRDGSFAILGLLAFRLDQVSDSVFASTTYITCLPIPTFLPVAHLSANSLLPPNLQGPFIFLRLQFHFLRPSETQLQREGVLRPHSSRTQRLPGPQHRFGSAGPVVQTPLDLGGQRGVLWSQGRLVQACEVGDRSLGTKERPSIGRLVTGDVLFVLNWAN